MPETKPEVVPVTSDAPLSPDAAAPPPLTDALALCLSGGGYRAMLFHLGTLCYLNDAGYLPKLDRVSSVSGGSITAGLLALRWKQLQFDATGKATNFAAVVADPIRKMAVDDDRRRQRHQRRAPARHHHQRTDRQELQEGRSTARPRCRTSRTSRASSSTPPTCRPARSSASRSRSSPTTASAW